MSDISGLSLQRLLENAYIGVVIHKWDTEIVYANSTATRLLQLDTESFIGKDSWDPQWYFVDEDGKRLMVEQYPVNKVKRTNQDLKDDIIGLQQEDSEQIRWFKVNAYKEGQGNSESQFIVVTFNDISDAKNLFSYQDILENTQDAVIVTDASEIAYPLGPKIIYVNDAFEKLTGYSASEAIGETPRILQGELTSKESKDRIQSALENKEAVTETLLNYDKSGRPYWIEMSIIPLKSGFGEVTHFAAIERDVSERKFLIEQLKRKNEDLKAIKKDLLKLVEKRSFELQRTKEKLELIAYIDPLTNIPNRRNFLDQTQMLIATCQRQKLFFAMGMIDLDDFKKVNDTYGHAIGDAVLSDFAARLKKLFRSSDVYCRYGGEEFAFAVGLISKEGANHVGKRLASQKDKFHVTVSNKQEKPEKIIYSVSVGIAIYDGAELPDKDLLLNEADAALYQAKAAGKNCFKIHNVK